MTVTYYIPGATDLIGTGCEYVQGHEPFVVGGKLYLGGWLATVSPDDRAAIGAIQVVDEGGHGDPRQVVNGEVMDGPVRRLTAVPRPAEEVAAALDRAKADAKAGVDAAAETARQGHLTPGSGQAMVYQAKATEAHSLLAGGSGPYPHLAVEVGVTARLDGALTATATDVAEVILAMEAAWLAISAEIEGTRLRAKRAISEAGDFAEIDAVMASVVWPAG